MITEKAAKAAARITPIKEKTTTKYFYKNIIHDTLSYTMEVL